MQCDGDKEIFHKWILWKEEADKSVPEQFKTKKLPECHYSGEMMSTRSLAWVGDGKIFDNFPYNMLYQCNSKETRCYFIAEEYGTLAHHMKTRHGLSVDKPELSDLTHSLLSPSHYELPLPQRLTDVQTSTLKRPDEHKIERTSVSTPVKNNQLTILPKVYSIKRSNDLKLSLKASPSETVNIKKSRTNKDRRKGKKRKSLKTAKIQNGETAASKRSEKRVTFALPSDDDDMSLEVLRRQGEKVRNVVPSTSRFLDSGSSIANFHSVTSLGLGAMEKVESESVSSRAESTFDNIILESPSKSHQSVRRIARKLACPSFSSGASMQDSGKISSLEQKPIKSQYSLDIASGNYHNFDNCETGQISNNPDVIMVDSRHEDTNSEILIDKIETNSATSETSNQFGRSFVIKHMNVTRMQKSYRTYKVDLSRAMAGKFTLLKKVALECENNEQFDESVDSIEQQKMDESVFPVELKHNGSSVSVPHNYFPSGGVDEVIYANGGDQQIRHHLSLNERSFQENNFFITRPIKQQIQTDHAALPKLFDNRLAVPDAVISNEQNSTTANIPRILNPIKPISLKKSISSSMNNNYRFSNSVVPRFTADSSDVERTVSVDYQCYNHPSSARNPVKDNMIVQNNQKQYVRNSVNIFSCARVAKNSYMNQQSSTKDINCQSNSDAIQYSVHSEPIIFSNETNMNQTSTQLLESSLFDMPNLEPNYD